MGYEIGEDLNSTFHPDYNLATRIEILYLGLSLRHSDENARYGIKENYVSADQFYFPPRLPLGIVENGFMHFVKASIRKCTQ